MPGKKRIVTITGATGFVGRATVARLLEEKNIQVRCMLRPGGDRSALDALSDSLSYCEGDITRPDTLEAAFAGSWGVINLAGYREFWARDRQHFYTINQQGAENVFRACLSEGVDKVVQVSTPLAWGVPKTLPFNESSAPGPHPSDYGRSKYLGDAAEAITRALLAPDSVGQRFLIGEQRATTREYFNIIGDLADVPIPSVNIPERWLLPTARAMEWVARRTGKRPVIPLDVIKTTAAGSLLFSAEKSKRELKIQYTPLREALAESVAEIQQESG